LRDRFAACLCNRSCSGKTLLRRDCFTDTARYTCRLGNNRRAVDCDSFASRLRNSRTDRRALLCRQRISTSLRRCRRCCTTLLYRQRIATSLRYRCCIAIALLNSDGPSCTISDARYISARRVSRCRFAAPSRNGRRSRKTLANRNTFTASRCDSGLCRVALLCRQRLTARLRCCRCVGSALLYGNGPSYAKRDARRLCDDARSVDRRRFTAPSRYSRRRCKTGARCDTFTTPRCGGC